MCWSICCWIVLFSHCWWWWQSMEWCYCYTAARAVNGDLQNFAMLMLGDGPRAFSLFKVPIGALTFNNLLTLYCRWVELSTWTPPPQDCFYLGLSPSFLDNSFFADSLWTCYNFLASLQIIFNWENAQSKFLDNFLSII